MSMCITMEYKDDIAIEHITCWPPESTNQHENKVETKYIYPIQPKDSDTSTSKRKTFCGELTDNCCQMNNESKVISRECYAEVALAKWLRNSHKNKLMSKIDFPNCNNPKTVLNFIVRTKPARVFMKQEVERIKTSLNFSNGKQLSSIAMINKLAALTTYYEKLKLFKDAKETIDKAIGIEVSENEKDDVDSSELKWMQEKINRQLTIIESQQLLLPRVKALHILEILQVSLVERRSAKNLSIEEFYNQYASKSVPVVITDLAEQLTSVPWTFEHISERAGDCTVTLKKLQTDSAEWARLEDSHTSTVSTFIRELDEDKAVDDKSYLFDWSIPIHCPRLAEEITIPKYFANDFLQRTTDGSLYKDSWPSLFIAPAGLRSELHVDAFGSNFWMALFEGRKRWLFFAKEEKHLLYPEYVHSMDPVFEIDLRKPDFDKHPLLALIHPKECILQPGEVLFVPAGCPHRVENLEKSLAISANFVDQSNFGTVKQELTVNALTDERAKDLVNQLNRSTFNTMMDYSIINLPWADFKGMFS